MENTYASKYGKTDLDDHGVGLVVVSVVPARQANSSFTFLVNVFMFSIFFFILINEKVNLSNPSVFTCVWVTERTYPLYLYTMVINSYASKIRLQYVPGEVEGLFLLAATGDSPQALQMVKLTKCSFMIFRSILKIITSK